ncbi:glucokinase [Virgibacillus pantothenticus]|nr:MULTISPECIES: ROK family glucokinase [Virgibacillus]MEB5451502.1 ROK family glucokinase [Virgibacillus pantothenticus]MEB5455528.1 ROK family glucokinase [Virgibacillus pantothenticus]MEB5459431.1 ROK family glucokinase [Virgibacillus pantothenticus]MEB5463835.1 ROK family glucokinase [Virgibacillus pantothenticus]MEB5467608.1 ROK family glucokinase [Virgibacillus pantothenticus]
MEQIIIGMDIGGTTAKLGLISDIGDIIYKWEVPTNTDGGGQHIVDDIWNSVSQKLQELQYKQDQVLGIGVGAPGFIEDKTGFVYEAVNIGWKNYPLGEFLTERSKLPVFVENDANVAALGENWRGAGNQVANLIAITLGTGVGGGIIANGRVVSGEAGIGGEIGHVIVDLNGSNCNCGRKGCLETIASATGIARQAIEKAQSSPESGLAKILAANGSLTSKDVFQLAEEDDSEAKEIVAYTMDVLGMAIANMCVTLSPAKVLIGGGVSKAGQPLLTAIEKAFVRYALPKISENCELKFAQLGNDAGIIGAAFLVKQKLEKKIFGEEI